MSNIKVFDENVKVAIIREGIQRVVPFRKLVKGDYISAGTCRGVVVGEDAHLSDDYSYNGWLFYSVNGYSFFPEDFGAKAKVG